MSVAASNVNKIPIECHTPILALPEQHVFHPHAMLDIMYAHCPKNFDNCMHQELILLIGEVWKGSVTNSVNRFYGEFIERFNCQRLMHAICSNKS